MNSALLALALTTAATPASVGPRVLSLGGVVTETVYALGAEDQLVGVDKSSLYPEAALKTRPQVGYFRAFSAEGALSLKPSLALALDGAGPPPAIGALQKAGVHVARLEDARTVDGAKARLRKIAKLLDRVEAGEALVDKMEADLARLSPPPDARPRVLFVYARGGGTLNVSGKATAAHAMIELAGGENAVTSYDGFRPLTAEAVVAAKPDVILMTTHGLASLGGKDGLLQTPGVALTPAAKADRIVAMPDLFLLGFGPRLGEALVALQAVLTGAGGA